MDVKQVLPSTIEAIEIKRFTDMYKAYRKRGYNQPNAYFLAEQRWCGRAWSGYTSEPQTEPWSGDYSNVEPAWNREDWVGA